MFTKDDLIAKEQGFWDHVAPIGTVFSIGVVMGFVVGLAICYQVLFADISERLAEFATLKAMGYSDFRLFSIIVTQSVYLACWDMPPGWASASPCSSSFMPRPACRWTCVRTTPRASSG